MWADSGTVNKDLMLGELTGWLGEERKETFVAFGLSGRYCARNLIYTISLKLKTAVKWGRLFSFFRCANRLRKVK